MTFPVSETHLDSLGCLWNASEQLWTSLTNLPIALGEFWMALGCSEGGMVMKPTSDEVWKIEISQTINTRCLTERKSDKTLKVDKDQKSDAQKD